jgi:hypothetical protein
VSDADDLMAIADQIAALKSKFIKSSALAMYLPTDAQGEWEALLAEARTLIRTALGTGNDFLAGIANAVNSGLVTLAGGPSYNCVNSVESLVRGAVRQIARNARARSAAPIDSSTPQYVDLARIAAIESLQGNRFDFAKLARLCKELNAAHAADCRYATAMLVRAIADHVPPLFGMKTFTQVASNYGGTASFRKSMEHLDRSLRNIADGILHEQIRARESLPSTQQVDFRQDLDRLLGEIVRITPQESS